MTEGRLTPAKILQLGTGFWGSKTLLSAIELGVFTELGKGALDGEVLRTRLQLHPRSARDFFDALVALGMFTRTGSRYANTAETGRFLDRNKPTYIGGILEMCNARLYGFWGSLTDGLRTGQPQNEVKTGGALIIHEALIDDARTRNTFGLLMSLNMLIETHGGFDFTGADCRMWMKETGFKRTLVTPLAGPDGMVVGFK